MNTEKRAESKESLVRVKLECGRRIVSMGKDRVAGYPGDCESYTSNQTAATCC